MDLMGAYVSKLPSWHYEELLALLEAGVAEGDYGGGALVNAQTVADLTAQGNDFTTLPAILAGSRALAESVNYPLALLAARYAAIVSEQQDFVSRMAQYLAVLETDAGLVDQLLTAVELENWADQQPEIGAAARFYADFGATHGLIDDTLPLTDPATGIAYMDGALNPLRPVDVVALMSGTLEAGLGGPVTNASQVSPSSLSWTYNESLGNVEVLTGTDWARATLLAPAPLLSLNPPVVSIILPESQTNAMVFQVQPNQSSTGNLPVFVQISFLPRRIVDRFTVTAAGQSFPMSLYRVTTDNLIVYDALQSYSENQDYQLDITTTHWNFVALSSLVGKTVSLIATEYFPAYQCSVNNLDWSPALFLDANYLYPDPKNSFIPVTFQKAAPGDPLGDWFPVTDELGTPVGIFMRPLVFLDQEYLFRVQTPASQDCGMTVTLEVELSTPGYYNALSLEPFTDMPAYLTQIDAEGIVSDQIGTPVYTGPDVLIDRPMQIYIGAADGAPLYVRKLFLTFRQENYSLIEQIIDPPDQLRRDSLAQIQAVIPFTTRIIEAVAPQRQTGAQYEVGVRNIAGMSWTSAAGPGVLVSGPFPVDGCPEVVRLDVDRFGSITGSAVICYLYCKTYDGSGNPPTLTLVASLLPGAAISFPDFVATLGVSTIARVEFFLKWVISDGAVLQRYLLQVSSR